MLSSLYSLVTINPEKKIRRNSYFQSSREPTEEKEVDIDNYDNEEF